MESAQLDLLVISAQNGNARAFSKLFEYFHTPLLKLAYKICGDEYMANEAVQEAWVNCSKNLKKLRDARAFKSWIYRNVRWRALDQLRKRTKHHASYDEVDSFPSQIIENDEKLERNESDSYLRKLINQLPETDRQALHLFYLDEMKIVEIAIVLEIPSGTVKSRLDRARKQLKKQLESLEK